MKKEQKICDNKTAEADSPGTGSASVNVSNNKIKLKRGAVLVIGNNNTVQYNGTRCIVKKVYFKPIDSGGVTIKPKKIKKSGAIYIEIEFSSLQQLQQISNSVKKTLINWGCDESQFNQWVISYLQRKGGEKYSIMASSLLNSCQLYDNSSPSESIKNKLNAFIKNDGKKNCFVFLSAVTLKNANKNFTIEYLAAQQIKRFFDELGIGVFWWEDDKLTSDEWLVSTKIAAGLSLSSIFICLAFDSVEQDEGGNVDFKCFTNSQCLGYEIGTFKEFALDCEGKHKPFVKDFFSHNTYDNFFPSTRKLRVFSYGEPKNHRGCNNVFDKLEGCIRKVEHKSNMIEQIKAIFQAVVNEVFSLINSQQEFKSLFNDLSLDENKLQEEIQKWLDKIEEEYSGFSDSDDRYAYLYKPFDPEKFDDGKYGDNFLNPKTWAVGENRKAKKYKWMAENGNNKENFEAVPRDYYFRYAIVDKNGQNAKNHFLVFPERYNDKHGNFAWRIKLVVRDWNLRAIDDAKYREELLSKTNTSADSISPNDDFRLSKYRKMKFTPIDESQQQQSSPKGGADQSWKDYSNKETRNQCAFILCDEALKMTAPTYALNGTLMFYDDYKAESDSNNNDERESSNGSESSESYFLSLTFYPKKIVYTRSDKTDDDTTIYLKPLKPVKDKNKKDKKLKKQANRCPCCGRIITDDAKLSGDEGGNENYCYSPSLKDGYRVCEYNFIGCAYYADDNGNMVKSHNDTKYGDFDTDAKKKVNNAYRTVSKWVERLNSNGMKSLEETPVQIHDGFEATVSKVNYSLNPIEDSGLVITLMGTSQSGKSTFISRLFDVYNPITENNVYITNAFLKNAVKPYACEAKFVGVFTDDPNTAINEKKLQEDYATSYYSKFLTMTRNDSDPVLPHIPFLLQLENIQSGNKKCYVSFFDLPGGLFENPDGNNENDIEHRHKDFTMFYRSDAIIVLLNDSNEDSSNMHRLLDFLEKVDKDVIIAIVWCQSDTIMADMQNGIFTVSTPTAREAKFENSLRHRYINACSKDIEEYIRCKKQNVYAKLNSIFKFDSTENDAPENKKFDKYKFFGVSAIGRSDSIVKHPSEKSTYNVFETNPFNIDNVILWILYMKGIIS